MKKTVLISLITIALISVSCVWASGRGKTVSGQTVTTQYFAGQTITALKVSNMFKVDLSYGTENSVELTINKEFTEHLEINLDNGELTLKLDKDWNNKYSNHSGDNIKISAKVVCKSLNSLKLSGMAQCKIIGEIPSPGLNLRIGGMSNCTEGTINVDGDCTANVGGMSGFETNLKIKGNTEASVSGMSKFSPNLTATGTVSLEVNGMSTANISGSATSVNIDCSGMSNVNIKNFDAPLSKASSSGMSNLYSK